ncbi:PDR/VanB family oxidoreductase [Variovorax sp. J31P207]|uniref:PDR/VanB family oxidoreductase n=1 Tax=Variovorax sp. J31P207 TaxID=3053510 RepID=UPI0033653F88
MMTQDATLQARIRSVSYACEDVLLFDLRAPDGRPLPPFTAGAHVDVQLPGGLNRSYSLLNDPVERHRYVIGVKREASSRGGSAWMHDSARAGLLIDIAGPRNHFGLVEQAPHSVLIAGGIGITPLWSMAQRLQALQRPWTLHYRARSRSHAPLLEELSQNALADRVHLSFSDASDGARLDLASIVGQAPPGAHFYCCGPQPMIEGFEAATRAIEPERVHLEHFGAKEAPATEGGFAVRLAKSGRVIEIAPGQTILDSLRSCGVAVASSCQQGVCGLCETRVISGTPDHRDLVLSDEEKAAGQTMMICCSGSRSGELVLDI